MNIEALPLHWAAQSAMDGTKPFQVSEPAHSVFSATNNQPAKSCEERSINQIIGLYYSFYITILLMYMYRKLTIFKSSAGARQGRKLFNYRLHIWFPGVAFSYHSSFLGHFVNCCKFITKLLINFILQFFSCSYMYTNYDCLIYRMLTMFDCSTFATQWRKLFSRFNILPRVVSFPDHFSFLGHFTQLYKNIQKGLFILHL